MKNLIHVSIIILILSSSCKQELVRDGTQSKLIIRLNSEGNSIELIGLAHPVIEELKTDSFPDSLWTNFFAVYEEPGDPEMRDFQPALDGIYTIEEGIVRFKPKDNFRERDLYFARCYTKLLLQDAEDLIKARQLFISEDFIEYRFSLTKK